MTTCALERRAVPERQVDGEEMKKGGKMETSDSTHVFGQTTVVLRSLILKNDAGFPGETKRGIKLSRRLSPLVNL